MLDDPDLLDEVTDLVEAPTAILGHFEEKYLELPKPVLIAVMKKHQRYFSVLQAATPKEGEKAQSDNAQLLPYFIAIANSNSLAYPEVVRAGNEGVIHARYADAAYFYRHDTARPLESFIPRLGTLAFHEKLGSMLDKVNRLQKLAPQIARMLHAFDSQIVNVERAAALSKADLVSSMVVEMTNLQGVMGEIYALKSGESSEVAQAIREHYLPRFAGDANPETLPGLALSLADKLDSLVALFAVGAIPTASADPFGLRRIALGIIHNLLFAQIDFSISAGLSAAIALQPIEVSATTEAEINLFMSRRLQGIFLETGYAHDVVEAIITAKGDNPYSAQRTCNALSILINQTWWRETFTAYTRCARITQSLTEQLPLNPSAYLEPIEHQLHAAYLTAVATLKSAIEPVAVLGEQLQTLQKVINAYFDSILVNAKK
jgi:glycyl-tRNA synthetase